MYVYVYVYVHENVNNKMLKQIQKQMAFGGAVKLFNNIK